MNKHGRPVDKNTFGDSKAEETLAIILEERSSKSATKFVSKTLLHLTKHLNNIEFVNDQKAASTKAFLYDMIRRNTLETIDKSVFAKNYPDITTYLKNAATKRLRNFIRQR